LILSYNSSSPAHKPGIDYPLIALSGESLFAYFMYTVYHNVMFPKQNAGHAIASLYQTLPEKDGLTRMASALMTQTQVPTAAAMLKKRATRTKKKVVAKKVKLKSNNTKAASKNRRTTKETALRPVETIRKRVVAKKAKKK
jgi:hypothetical protein